MGNLRKKHAIGAAVASVVTVAAVVAIVVAVTSSNAAADGSRGASAQQADCAAIASAALPQATPPSTTYSSTVVELASACAPVSQGAVLAENVSVDRNFEISFTLDFRGGHQQGTWYEAFRLAKNADDFGENARNVLLHVSADFPLRLQLVAGNKNNWNAECLARFDLEEMRSYSVSIRIGDGHAQLLIDGRMVCMVVHTDTDALEDASLITSNFYEPVIGDICGLQIRNIVGDCDVNPCENGASCVDIGPSFDGRYTCECADGFRGPLCETAASNSECLTMWSEMMLDASEGDDVVVPFGTTVLLDMSPPNLTSISVEGTLVFADKPLEVNVNWIRVHDKGELVIGTEDAPLTEEIVITFNGARDESGSDIGTSAIDPGPLGSKGLAVQSGGKLRMFGNALKPAWTRVTETVQVIQRTLPLEDAVEWRVGDKIVIASTDFWDPYDGAFPQQSEEHEIASVSEDRRTVTLVAPLQYMHYGDADIDQRAEVGLLTRNIRLQGDLQSNEEQFGGHSIFRLASMIHIRGVEFTRMGQQGLAGRYPVHWHLTGDQGQRSSYRVEECSIHHNYQRCITVHDTQNVLLKNNVCFNTFGHMYFLEDGSEIDNRFEGNLGVYTQPTHGDRRLIPSDGQPTAFWITNPANTFINNVGVSADTGFWFSLPPKPNGLSTHRYTFVHMYPRSIPIAEFRDNVAHSLSQTGLQLDFFQDMYGLTSANTYIPTVSGLSSDANLQETVISNFVAYKCRSHGIWVRARWLRITGARVMDNFVGVFHIPGRQLGPALLENSRVVGETANIGHPPEWDSRSRPRYDGWPIYGYQMYNSGGPQFMRNVEFVNFVPNGGRMAQGVAHMFNHKGTLLPQDSFESLSFDNALELFFTSFPRESGWASAWSQGDNTRFLVFNDKDGSVSGIPGAFIASHKTTLNTTGECISRPEWNAMVCPPSDQPFVGFSIKNEATHRTDFTLPADHALPPDVNVRFFRFGDTEKLDGLDMYGVDGWRFHPNLPARNGYVVRWEYETPPILDLQMYGCFDREWLVFAIPYPAGTTFWITRWKHGDHIQVDSRDQLSRDTYFYDSSSELLYVMLQRTFAKWHEAWGFTWHDKFPEDTQIRITATCPNDDCYPRDSASFVVPDVIKIGDRYRTQLVSTQVPGVDAPTSLPAGDAYLQFNPRNFELSWYIAHTLPGVVTRAVIESGAGRVEVDIRTTQYVSLNSPVRGAIAVFSRRQWRELYSGNLYVSMESETSDGGKHAIRGRLGCLDGACSEPLTLAADPCERAPRTPLLAPGMIVRFESANFPEEFIRHENWVASRQEDDGTVLFIDDSSWIVEEGLSGEGLSFRAANIGNHYLHQGDSSALDLANYEGNEANDTFKASASFTLGDALESGDGDRLSLSAVDSGSGFVRHREGGVYLETLDVDVQTDRLDATWILRVVAGPAELHSSGWRTRDADKVLCGDSAVLIDLPIKNYHAHVAIRRHVVADPSTHAFFQFYVKDMGSDFRQNLEMELGTPDGALYARVWPHYIDNFVIENEWTRVRIPVADFGIVDTVEITYMELQQFEWWFIKDSARALAIDRIQFIEDTPDEFTSSGLPAFPFAPFN